MNREEKKTKRAGILSRILCMALAGLMLAQCPGVAVTADAGTIGAKTADFSGKKEDDSLAGRMAGKVKVLPYDYLCSFHEGMAAVEKDGKIGFIDKKGREIVKPKYDGDRRYAYDTYYGFSEGLAEVEKDGKWGYVDQKGREVIKPEYDEAKYFSGGLAVVIKDGKYCYINKKGRVVMKMKLYIDILP